jgi:hypothetical protein
VTATPVLIWEHTYGLGADLDHICFCEGMERALAQPGPDNRFASFTSGVNGKHEIYRSMTSVIEVVRLQCVECLAETRFICYSGMGGMEESDEKH